MMASNSMYPSAIASGVRISSRRKKYMAQKTRVTMASIGSRIETKCMWMAIMDEGLIDG